jgi:hypothetical protein
MVEINESLRAFTQSRNQPASSQLERAIRMPHSRLRAEGKIPDGFRALAELHEMMAHPARCR